MLVLFGALAGVLAAVFEGWRGLVAVLAAGVAYLLLSHGVFSARHFHLALFVPLVVQVPVAILAGLFLHYLLQRRQRESLARVMGFFVPVGAVERLAQGEEPGAGGEQVQGTIVATDAVDYTSLSERLSPPALQETLLRHREN